MSTAQHPPGIGIVGYGGFGQFLHRSWVGMDGIEIRAVADANPALRSAAEKASPSVIFYSDWRELIADPDVDVVSIATPPSMHAEMACAAMRAGKHVLIEKPLATTRDDALRIRAAADETGRIAAVDYMLRFNPIVEVLQSWAREGTFGALRRVVVENYAQDESLPKGHWFWDRKKSGGILVEHAVHFIDVVNGCTEAGPVFVDGFELEREDGRTDRMGLTAIFGDGLVTQQYHAFSRPGFFEETGMRFVFDLAQVDVEGWIPLCGRLTALTNGDTVDALQRMPGFETHERTNVATVADASRPAGWGAAPAGAEPREALQDVPQHAPQHDPRAAAHRSPRGLVHSGGVPYHITEQTRGTFALPVPKSEAYADALRAMMADVATAVRDPNHRLRTGVEEGLRSLDIALVATEQAGRR